MKTVKLVDITVKEVPYYGYNEVQYYHRESSEYIPYKDGLLHCDATVKTKVVPITHICQVGKEDVAVAYTEEFEEVCVIPIRMLIREKKEWKELAELYCKKYPILEVERDTYFLNLKHFKEATFFQRLKYLFTVEL